MNIYIPNIAFKKVDKKELFILTRPFYSQNAWTNAFKKDWFIDDNKKYVENVFDATHFLIPMNINWYFKTKNQALLIEYNMICKEKNIKAFGIIAGDFGINYPDFSNIIYFRQGGFKNQLSKNNFGFPVSLSDHFERLYGLKEIIPTKKNQNQLSDFVVTAHDQTPKEVKNF